ncbi:hypothetical protein [Noviherbaspirillum soli]|uniref:hypothetical protein n=1 Tax=Noviherbaspirillum soli TaxID=1064518 RepID=UPI00188B6F8A|nr:hypothetical protein [Noviherbaspirillum soli]
MGYPLSHFGHPQLGNSKRPFIAPETGFRKIFSGKFIVQAQFLSICRMVILIAMLYISEEKFSCDSANESASLS